MLPFDSPPILAGHSRMSNSHVSRLCRRRMAWIEKKLAIPQIVTTNGGTMLMCELKMLTQLLECWES